MALVCAAHGERDLDDRQIGRVEELPGPLDSASDHILVRRNADCLSEHMRKVMRTDTERFGYVRERQVFVAEMTIDERKGLLHPVHRQSSLRTAGWELVRNACQRRNLYPLRRAPE
jgi:hypothetical protein